MPIQPGYGPIFFLLMVFCQSANAQSTAGLTHIPDTSYSNYSAYTSTKKQFPDIRLVPELHSPAVKEKKDLVYCTQGEKKLLIDAFFPSKKAGQKRAAILIIHGGGWRSGNRTQHYPLAQKLASLGYACFTPEYRLSTEALFPAAVYDLKAALRWIRAHAGKYHVDPNRIAVLGFSAGGELAAFLAVTNHNAKFEGSDCHTKYSSEVQALIDLDGTLSFVHPESAEGDDSKKTSASTYWFGFSKKDNPQLLQEASPLTHAGPGTPPTLFINSSVARMHAGRDDFMKLLRENHIYTEVKTFDPSPHSFPLFDPWFEPTVQYTDDFLKKIFFEKKPDQ